MKPLVTKCAHPDCIALIYQDGERGKVKTWCSYRCRITDRRRYEQVWKEVRRQEVDAIVSAMQ